ncbi:Serine protease SPPA, chloroplastic [Linum perenne]
MAELHRLSLASPPQLPCSKNYPTRTPMILLHRRTPRTSASFNRHRTFSLRSAPGRRGDRLVVRAFESKEVVVNDQPPSINRTTSFKKTPLPEFPGDPDAAFEVRKQDGGWEGFLLKLRLMIAPPWQRVPQGSVLTIDLGGTVTDVKGRWFGPPLALPEICENFAKAANDPRISGVYLRISLIECGWAKLDEIRRHILDFRKSGKFVIGYLSSFREKEYYLGCACDELYAHALSPFSLYGFTLQSIFLRGILEKMGLEPQWVRIGKYKKAGDQMIRKTISEPHLEVLNSLLDGRYKNWVETVCSATGKKREDLENLINEGVYVVSRLKEEGLITDILYEDEVMLMLKKKLGVPKEKDLPTVDYKKYSKVTNWTLGLNSGEDAIGVIRASGLVVMAWSLLNTPGSAITPESIKKQIRKIRESKKYKAAVIRIDCAGGDALASDLIWKEIQLLAAEKPVIASLSDMAASGGYYIAMGSTAIVAEKLSVASSIGIIQGKMNYSELHKRIGLNKHVITRGKYAEFPSVGHRPLRPDEKELLENQTMHWYEIFRDKAAFSRSMTVEDMEKVAQGRVWNGEDALANGLVDAVGGMSRAIAIAKHKANIPLNKPVEIVELTKPTSSMPEFIAALGTTIASLDRALAMGTTYNGARAQVDFPFQDNPIFTIMKCFLMFNVGGLFE